MPLVNYYPQKVSLFCIHREEFEKKTLKKIVEKKKKLAIKFREIEVRKKINPSTNDIDIDIFADLSIDGQFLSFKTPIKINSCLLSKEELEQQKFDKQYLVGELEFDCEEKLLLSEKIQLPLVVRAEQLAFYLTNHFYRYT